jgi:hypothetical protein
MISRRRPAWLPTLVAGVVFAWSFSCSLPGLAVLPALAQNSTTVLQGGATYSEPATGLSRNDLPTQQKIDAEDDQHDTNDAAIDDAEREENVEHDYHLKAIEQSQVPGEVKQEAIADENERHQDALAHFQRQQALEDERHAQRITDIMAAAGKLLSGAASAVGNSLNNGNGGAQSGGGSSPPPSNPSTSNPANPATGNSGNPPTTTSSNPPAQNSSPPAVAQQPSKPLDFIPNAVNNAVRNVPNGERILQGAAEVSRAAGQGAADSITKDLQNLDNTTRQLAQQLEDQWTKDSYGGAKQVAAMFAFEGLAAGVQGTLAARTAMQAGAPLKNALSTGGSAALQKSVLGGPNGLGALASRGPGALDEASNAGGANGSPLNGNVDSSGEPAAGTAGGNGGPGEPAGGGNAPSETAPSDESSGPGAGNEEFPPASDPVSRGMPPAIDNALKALAKRNKWIIVVRDSNPAAERWVGQEGYLPKPQALKAKSIPYDPAKPMSEQPNAGLVRADKLSELEKRLGYKIDPDTGLVSQDGKHFYSDIDVHGVYDSAGNDVTRKFFNELIKNPQYRNSPLQELIQHYPHDWWQFRNNPEIAGTNYGPQVGGGKTATAYLPDSTVRLDTIAQMKALYSENKINFSWLYPHH